MKYIKLESIQIIFGTVRYIAINIYLYC